MAQGPGGRREGAEDPGVGERGSGRPWREGGRREREQLKDIQYESIRRLPDHITGTWQWMPSMILLLAIN